MRVSIVFILLFSLSTVKGQSIADQIDAIYSEGVTADGFVDYKSISKDATDAVMIDIANTSIIALSENETIAFYINTYNISVIHKVLSYLPQLTSVQDQSSFFKDKIDIAGERLSLDEVEQKVLKLRPGGDIHMVLNCGALSCPPLYPKAFRGPALSSQINEAVASALDSPQILKVEKEKIRISKIFQWYISDFGRNAKAYISAKKSKDYSTKQIAFLPYDWTLNDINNAALLSSSTTDEVRYFASNLYSRGSYEVSSFNNYYSQLESDYRSNWFTSSWTFLYGINKRLNVGLDFRLRSTTTGIADSISTFGALSFPSSRIETDAEGRTIRTGRTGLSAVGLRVKYQPIKRISNLTFQHLIYIPTIGYEESGFLDWESPYIFNDAYYDVLIGGKSSVFFNVGLHIENMNQAFFGSGDGFYQLSTPLNLIYSYFPTKKSTIYVLSNYAPRWGYSVSGANTDVAWAPYGQLGLGAKYFVTPDIQVELLYTKFFDNVPGRSANTYNLGLRYYGW